MLFQLTVKNLALIDEAHMDFSGGLIVLSGETGAGKSMIIDAVGLLLGGRGSNDLIRHGADNCLVEGTFSAPQNEQLCALLQEAEIEDDGELILTRILSASGKNSCRINLRQVPLTFFKQVGRLLINIHGQMEHVSILESANQQRLLDRYGSEPQLALLDEVGAAYAQYYEAKKQAENLLKKESDLSEQYDLWKFQLHEIEQVGLQVGEEEKLALVRNRLRNATELKKQAITTYSALGGNSERAATVGLSIALDNLRELAKHDESLLPVFKQLQEVYYNVEDIVATMRSYKEDLSGDPRLLEETENRLYSIKEICRKYGGSEAAALAKAEANRQAIDAYDNRELYLQQAQNEAERCLAAYQQVAKRLTAARLELGGRLAQQITQELHDLQMADATFGVDILPAAAGRLGCDEVCFTIQPNVGEGFGAVAKIASGGEMSRIMLAIKVILARLDDIGTLIFDEIDSGLGGVALRSVADKLVAVSAYTQAICVTHAPVVAAYAHQHALVEKLVQQERTVTQIQNLSGEQREQEICRMLAGDKITQATHQQAREMLAAGVLLQEKYHGLSE